MDGGAWWATAHGVTKESDTTKRLHFHVEPKAKSELSWEEHQLVISCKHRRLVPWVCYTDSVPSGLPRAGLVLVFVTRIRPLPWKKIRHPCP